MKKLVMFDMDGVLFDSMPMHSEFWVEEFAAAGVKIDRKEIYLFEGMPGRSIVPLILQKYGGGIRSKEEMDAINDRKCARVTARGPVPVMDGAREAVKAAFELGAKCIVVTGSAQKSILERVDDVFEGRFCDKVTALDGLPGKPAPDPYLAGLRKAGICAEQAIVVENAPLGVRAAKAAGCFTIAVNTGPLPDSALLEEGADVLLHSMRELPEFFRTLV